MRCYNFAACCAALVLVLSLAVTCVCAQEANKVDIHGFVSQGFIYSTGNNFMADSTEDGSFEFNELGINFATNVEEDIRVGMQLFS